MPKRKHDRSEDRYKRKIKRLKRKLKEKQKTKRNRSRTTSQSSSASSRCTTPAPTTPPIISIESDEIECDVENPEILDSEVTGTECIDSTKENLDDSIITALGQTISSDKEYGPDIHVELVKRVEVIITQGLKQDLKEDLVKKYLIPSNTKLLDAPKLNKELENLLNDFTKTRDKKLEEHQQQLGVAIAALLSTTDSLIKNNYDKIKLISSINDATRLLLDIHHQDTITRKKLIIPNLDKNIGKTVEILKRDLYLFGEKFSENVKIATAIKKSAGTILKNITPNRKTISTNRPNFPQNYNKRQGNFRGPPRSNVTQFKQGGGRYHQHQRSQYSQKPKPLQRTPAKPSVRQT